jgi:L-threonylcarbamoyladenylate synthase
VKNPKIDAVAIHDAVKVLDAGGAVVYPTDTAYGLAVDATNLKAVERLYAIKGRDFTRPVHVIFPSYAWLAKTVKLNPIASKLIQKYFPGPLTIVLPLKSKGKVWTRLAGNTATLGFRMPNSPIVRTLLAAFGRPITTTSANVGGKGTPYSVSQIKKQYQKAEFAPDFYLNGGKLKRVKTSTIVRIEGNSIQLLREGPIKFQEIKKLVE